MYVYDFSKGSRGMAALLGGKGAGIAEMTNVLGAGKVPGGFTITTEACTEYMAAGRADPPGLEQEVAAALGRLEKSAGKRLGDADDPLLVSVRSGARMSMPGMMDTVLNVGLNDRSVGGLENLSSDPRFAWDSYRRLIQLFGSVVLGVPAEMFEERIDEIKGNRSLRIDAEMGELEMRDLVDAFKETVRGFTGEEFPQNPEEQMWKAVHAVFDSWNGRRAIEYRRIRRIPDDWGTAVNVQRMVFGNLGPTSGTGVAFSRDENTGEAVPSGDFLSNAQGEDVVSGMRTPDGLPALAETMPTVYAELLEILARLEEVYKDMQDVEFTVEAGRLYILQTRNAQRPAQAAVRVAVDMAREGILSRREALMSLDADKLESLLHPRFDPAATGEAIARGVAASPGAAKGEVVFTAADAIECAEAGRDVVLVRPFTEAEDVRGFFAARGILTAQGGKSSHAALVARGMGIPCVAGVADLKVDVDRREMTMRGRVMREGDIVSIDGTAGTVFDRDIPLVDAEIGPAFETVLAWADEDRRLGVRANADTPAEARKARRLGAEGIGLCRTEHMFMAADRQPKMKSMIMARDEADRRLKCAELEPFQQSDFEGLFEAMENMPVTIRLLDPPLHEFLPKRADLEVELAELRLAGGSGERTQAVEREIDRVVELEETNPMLGTRGCRLGILYPEIYEMQVRAIVNAAVAVRERTGRVPAVEIMIPLVEYEGELDAVRDLVVRVAGETAAQHGARGEGIEYKVGTMVELPRACLIAGRLAARAEFFSFGTNDLTQTALGLSRDDVEGSFLATYVERRIVERSPFETLDVAGVGELIKTAARRGREQRPDLGLGVCGEHGGDPKSIEFFESVGLDYVSCSPFRVPIARVAAAQAAVRERDRSEIVV